ncbi:MAG: sigma-E processing peptidase SpoIIGA [Clostridia bacterium]|nr:sigma-E processing peptidase SpoIIGA [Clostridia bacterium]
MQVIYIDTLLCVNLFIDYFILNIERRILHINSRHIRILLGAVVGSLSTLIVFLDIYSTWFSLIYKPLSAILIIIIAYGYDSIRKLLIRSMAFLGFSMLLCGSVLVIDLVLKPEKLAVYNDTVYFDISPTLLICSTLITYLALSVYQKISDSGKLKCKVKNVLIYTDTNSRMSFESAVDTGCNLKEPFSGLPVILTEKELLGALKIPPEQMRVIPLSTVAGEDMIMAFKPKSVFINNKLVHNGCYIGICDKKLNGEIKSIMGTELAEVS